MNKSPPLDPGDLERDYAIFFEDSTREANAPSDDFIEAMQRLSPRHAEFVKSYMRCGDGKRSAQAAGFAQRHAAVESCRLLKRADIRAAIDASRTTQAGDAIYDQTKAMAECLAGIKFAIQTENANALARLIELRSRLHGLLIDRIDVSVSTLDLSAALQDARNRALPPSPVYENEITLQRIRDGRNHESIT